MYMSTCIRNKNCHQHSYGFQNFMSSWGSWSKISKLQQVVDFSFLGLKVHFWCPKYPSIMFIPIGCIDNV